MAAGGADVITGVRARMIYDSRGNPTVEVDVATSGGEYRAAVPSGASTGIYEAHEARDGGSEWMGKGVSKAVAAVNDDVGPKLVGKSVLDQGAIDDFLIKEDGTENKARLGANAILGISLAVCRAAAAAKKVPLYQHVLDISGNKEVLMPVPSFNVINGGTHAGNALAMQEFMLLPTGAESFTEAMRIGAECYQHLKKIIAKKYGQDATNVGDEGGFAPNIQSNREGLQLVWDAVKAAGYEDKVQLGMDCAASEFFKDGKYDLAFKSDTPDLKTGEELAALYKEFADDFPVVSIEDPFDQDDWDAYAKLTTLVGDKVQIVGDDLLVTNPKRITTGIEKKACNALLLKVNQIGTVTEAIKASEMSMDAGWGVMVSHRSGETEDTFIADLVVGLGTGEIKTGAPCRSERTAKYNQLLRIEEEITRVTGKAPRYAGKDFRAPRKA